MDHYIDIRVLADPEFSEGLLMNALFSKAHRVIAELGGGEVGVCFPEYGKTLGKHLRLHGSKMSLERLMADGWLKGLRDYTEVSSISQVPANAKFRVVKRVQAKTNIDRLRRRSVSKGWLNQEEANTQITPDKERRLKLPFLQLKSRSTGQSFCLFIEHGKITDQARNDKFSTYGLSSNSTIPWF